MLVGRYDYESFINYFRHMYPDNVDAWWYGIRYRLTDNMCKACIFPKVEFKDQEVYLYKPQLLYPTTRTDIEESIYYFVPLETLKKMTTEQMRNTLFIFKDHVLVKKCKEERKLKNIEKDF